MAGRLLGVGAALIIAACAVPTTGVVPIGNGYYTIIG